MRLHIGLLLKIAAAIVLGIILGLFLTESWVRFFVTINMLFSSFLSYFIPFLILGLVTSGIAKLGDKAGRLLLVTGILAWLFTIVSGFYSYGVCELAYPILLRDTTGFDLMTLDNTALQPYFTVSITPLTDVLSALLTAFLFGTGIAATKSRLLLDMACDFESVIHFIIKRVIIPLLPLYIFGIFLKITFEGQITPILQVFLKLILLIFIMSLVMLILQYALAGIVVRRNPFKLLYTMLPAYVTALGTQSSAVTIPVTLEQTLKNKVQPDVARFVIPLCATIHLSGSMIKIVACTLAILLITDTTCTNAEIFAFILMLSFTMIAAPGVPGGAIMAAIGLLESMLGFGENEVGLMIALYITMDSFGTACNVTGDGAIAVIVEWLGGDLPSAGEQNPYPLPR
ncbi:MAG: dicarboxylate/amino acid:cation symporter [Planctomycetia bacterium]|nr:dicarboxylate/amino acid:cation symporter [Planctomycetia bacterium]